MSLKIFNFSDRIDTGIYIFLYGVIPLNIYGRIFLNYFQDFDGFLAFSLILFMIYHNVLVYQFSPMYVAIIEIRNNEIRFFKPFSNRWAPMDQYRFVANGEDYKKIIVYKTNCIKTGTIDLKKADSESKREFIEIIEPYLIVRGLEEANLENKAH